MLQAAGIDRPTPALRRLRECRPLARRSLPVLPISRQSQSGSVLHISAKAEPSTMTVSRAAERHCGARILSAVRIVRYRPSGKSGPTHASLSNSSLHATTEPALCLPLHSHKVAGTEPHRQYGTDPAIFPRRYGRGPVISPSPSADRLFSRNSRGPLVRRRLRRSRSSASAGGSIIFLICLPAGSAGCVVAPPQGRSRAGIFFDVFG